MHRYSAARAAIIDNAAADLGLPPWVVETNLWVCWLLARLHEIEELPALIFKGGHLPFPRDEAAELRTDEQARRERKARREGVGAPVDDEDPQLGLMDDADE